MNNAIRLHNRAVFSHLNLLKAGKDLDIAISKLAGDLFNNPEDAWTQHLMPHYSTNTDDAFKLPIPDDFEWELICRVDYCIASVNEQGDGNAGRAEILCEGHKNPRAYALCMAWLAYFFEESDRKEAKVYLSEHD